MGKITPKGETQLSPEEKLLKAIFGEKAGDVRDTSLRVPPGIQGTVIDVKVFSRKGIDKDSRAVQIEEEEIARIRKDFNDEIRIVGRETEKHIRSVLSGRVVSKSIKIGSRSFKKSEVLENGSLDNLKAEDLVQIPVKGVDLEELQALAGK